MLQTAAPNVGVDLIRIHKVISRGLDVSAQGSRGFASAGFDDPGLSAGFASYVQALIAILHGHHLTEDELAFPYFRDKLPDAPFDLLSSEHRAMAAALDETAAALDAVVASGSAATTMVRLHETLQVIDGMWRPHIRREEAALAPDTVAQLLSADEQIQLARRFAQHSQEHASPDYLVVPFMLYNLLPDDRAAFAQVMPSIVTQQLVPVVWKDKWAPMAPFLLA